MAVEIVDCLLAWNELRKIDKFLWEHRVDKVADRQ
jgi:hypothetical protein